jgi:hypothetical protein
MKKSILIAAGIVVTVLIGYFVVKGNKNKEAAEILATVKQGKFLVEIETTGELEAKNSVQILGPAGIRNYRIFNLSIEKIIEEGTVVKKGDWVADLDKSELTNKIKDAQSDLDQKESQYIQTQLDTALQMRQARNELVNLEYGVEEAEITLAQSQFEPPATVKQAEINLDKAKRAFQQARDNYKIKLQQNKAKMQEVAASLSKTRREYDGMLDVMKSFTITAPEDGMVIFRKGWDGKPIREGSQVNGWDPVVATLPDLNVMMSKTYVNEVDVRKIKPGQPVEIGLDAFPEKKLRGMVINVANVGEQRPNSDAKVFQVNIQVRGSDPLLRPSMTTSNNILTMELDSVLFIPLEGLFNYNDSITFVYKKEGLRTTKQEVEVGETNANEAVILAGLSSGDKVFVSTPLGLENVPVNLIPEMDGKRLRKETEFEPIELEPMITLPNGQVVPASRFRRPGQTPGSTSGARPQGDR